MNRQNKQVTRSNKFLEVQGYFRSKQWSAARVLDAVKMGWITEEEFEIITNNKSGKALRPHIAKTTKESD